MPSIYDKLMAKAAEWPHDYRYVTKDGEVWTPLPEVNWTPTESDCGTLGYCRRCALEALAREVCDEANLQLSWCFDRVFREEIEIPTACICIEEDIIGGPK